MVSATKTLFSLTASDIMSHDVVMIPREMSLQGAARTLARAGVSGAPVVDGAGRCIGVLSPIDFMHWVEKDDHPCQSHTESMCSAWQIPEDHAKINACVEEVMKKDPVLVTPGAKIGELAQMMIDAHIHRLIVVDGASQRPIGIVSSMDILAALARMDQLQKAAEVSVANEVSSEYFALRKSDSLPIPGVGGPP